MNSPLYPPLSFGGGPTGVILTPSRGSDLEAMLLTQDAAVEGFDFYIR